VTNKYSDHPLRKRTYGNSFRISARNTIISRLFAVCFAASVIIVAPLSMVTMVMMPQAAFAQTKGGSVPFVQSTFPPPIFIKLRDQPSYVINIPIHNSTSATGHTFDPMSISIPVGMTVIWFNNDIANHAIATISNSTYKPPESFQSGPILGINAGFGTTGAPLLAGGSFVHKFTKPGVYLYTDNLNPALSKDIAKISVGDATEVGKNMNMMIGGVNTIPLKPDNITRFVVAFVPKTISLPPVVSMTYNVTIMNSMNKVISRTFDDRDGILDLELVPSGTMALTGATNSTNASQSAGSGTSKEFITWGPDFIGQAGGYSTGTFHLQGPLFKGAGNANNNWSIVVSIISKDNTVLHPPLTDTFVLPFNTIGNANMTTTSLSNATTSK
jgi:plastocyanin